LAGAAVIALLVWNIGLQQQLAGRDAVLATIADVLREGQPAHAVSGSAGSGYVIDTDGPGATFLVAGLDEPPAGRVYELWLIDAGGTALAVGVIDDADRELTVATVEDDLAGYAAFAVTVEEERVAAPTQDPVMVGAINN
jgi:anti-sigma-K factor RskA